MIKQLNYSRILTETAIEIVPLITVWTTTIIVIEIVMEYTVAAMEVVQLLRYSQKMKLKFSRSSNSNQNHK